MVKVAVLGAGGGVGQALSLQLRLSPFVDELALYDRSKAAGVAVDLSHIPVKQVIKGYKAIDNGLTKALTGADLVIITAGPSVPPSPGAVFTGLNDLLQYSANIVGTLISSCGKTCPKAVIMIVSNPVNALIPFAAEVLKKHNAFDARRLLGVTTLDVVRAETFLAEMLGTMTERGTGVEVDVIGGHSAESTVPLFSRVELARKLSNEQLDELIYHTAHGGVEVCLAKDMKSGATLSTAYAIYRMAERVCRALKGEKEMCECSFVYLPGIDGGNEIASAVGVDYFSAPVEFAVDGAGRIANPLKGLSEKEEGMVKEVVKQVRKDLNLGSQLGKGFITDLQDPSL